jgi:hypothetical protein
MGALRHKLQMKSSFCVNHQLQYIPGDATVVGSPTGDGQCRKSNTPY